MKFLTEHFVPVKIHIKERPRDFGRFGAEWTPTLMLLEPHGKERYRFVGYLPIEHFLARLRLGVARAAFSRGHYEDAKRAFGEVSSLHPATTAAPEALYWAGVSGYKVTRAPEELRQCGKLLKEKYPDSEWAMKASVWTGPSA